MNQGKLLAISEQQAQAIVDYLVQRPYREVVGLIDGMRSLRVIEIPGPVADKGTDEKQEEK